MPDDDKPFPWLTAFVVIAIEAVCVLAGVAVWYWR